MSIVRIGLAGCGSVSQRGLLPHLAQEDIRQWCELKAVMDPVPGRARLSRHGPEPLQRRGAAAPHRDTDRRSGHRFRSA